MVNAGPSASARILSPSPGKRVIVRPRSMHLLCLARMDVAVLEQHRRTDVAASMARFRTAVSALADTADLAVEQILRLDAGRQVRQPRRSACRRGPGGNATIAWRPCDSATDDAERTAAMRSSAPVLRPQPVYFRLRLERAQRHLEQLGCRCLVAVYRCQRLAHASALELADLVFDRHEVAGRR